VGKITIHQREQERCKGHVVFLLPIYLDLRTVNVDSVTVEYVLLVKYQFYMSIWEFNLPIKQHNLIGPLYIGLQ
jgi:hypothetical protein